MFTMDEMNLTFQATFNFEDNFPVVKNSRFCAFCDIYLGSCLSNVDFVLDSGLTKFKHFI